MDFKSTIDLIIKDLNEASEIIDDLKKYPGVPILQVELAKSKCKSAGEVIALLKTLTEIIPPKDDRIVEKHYKKSEAAEPVKQVVDTPIVADKFSQPASRYDEQAGKRKTEKDLSDQLKTSTITSLSEAIGISDKFLFIGEIFDGNKEAYAQAIARLDKVESLDDAVTIIKSYTGEKPEGEAVVQLLDLVRLKLPSNE
jgi:copper chaperone CopZ